MSCCHLGCSSAPEQRSPLYGQATSERRAASLKAALSLPCFDAAAETRRGGIALGRRPETTESQPPPRHAWSRAGHPGDLRSDGGTPVPISVSSDFKVLGAFFCNCQAALWRLRNFTSCSKNKYYQYNT